jgi:hypothetical protein
LQALALHHRKLGRVAAAEQNPPPNTARRPPRMIQLTRSAATVGVMALIVLVVIAGVVFLI